MNVYLVFFLGLFPIAQEPVTVELAFDAQKKFTYLHIRNIVGEIEVMEHTQASVQVELKLLAPKRDLLSNRAGTPAVFDGNLGLRLVEHQNHLSIEGTHEDSDRHYRLWVPRGLPLIFDLPQNRDSLHLTGFSQAIEVNTRGADLFLNQVSGPLAVNTVFGNVHITFSKLDSQEPCHIQTGAGDIQLKLPSRQGATIHAETVRGELQNFKAQPTRGPIGQFQVTELVNGGGPHIHLETVRGDISL